MKNKEIKLESFFHLKQSLDGKYIWTYWKQADNFSVDQITTLILDGVPAWKDGFLLDESPHAIPASSPIQEAVVSQLV